MLACMVAIFAFGRTIESWTAECNAGAKSPTLQPAPAAPPRTEIAVSIELELEAVPVVHDTDSNDR